MLLLIFYRFAPDSRTVAVIQYTSNTQARFRSAVECSEFSFKLQHVPGQSQHVCIGAPAVSARLLRLTLEMK